MKKIRIFLMSLFISSLGCAYGQTPTSADYLKAKTAPPIQWRCPEINTYINLLNSLQNEDYKIYANNLKEKIELYSNPSAPSDKYLVTQAIFTINNPYFNTKNLLNHISTWIKTNKKDWAKNMKINGRDSSITSKASILVAQHANFFDVFKVSTTPYLIIKLIESDKLLISFSTNDYKTGVYSGRDNKQLRSHEAKISEAFPFVTKSSYKNSHAKAYVGTYAYFWNFISDINNELNNHFVRDHQLVAQLHYVYQKDSLNMKYGEPTKILADQTGEPDVNKEIRFYEEKQKAIFMGTTIDFKDIMSCEIVDDPQFIPGRTTTMGLGFSFFGFGIGGANSYRTADKTLHNYVVNINIDSMATPLIRIATGRDEAKATEIASVIDYILRHQDNSKVSSSKTKRKVTRRTKR